MKAFLDFSKKHHLIENLIYLFFILPCAFYIVLGISVINVTGTQEERTLNLMAIFVNSVTNNQVIFLGSLSVISFLLSRSVDRILLFVSHTIQYYMLFLFVGNDFLIEELSKLQLPVFLAGIAHMLHQTYEKRKNHINKKSNPGETKDE